ncbi:hypothetical protein GCM10011506_05880 [Marivirga lumbricoides]|uniref:DUF4920 domain-containing protein n=1 Tax=Marivirga lumbricoides TaxID=1046115 RepID=A0ABQ1LHV9_9BACT|nr:hypothetical protein GCM10011506_05880 [Marivirga lumbricoides]
MKAKLIAALFLFGAGVACNSPEKKQEETTAEPEMETSAIEEKDSTVFGESFDIGQAKQPEMVLANLQPQDSLNATIRGTVKEVCKAKGCWMTIDLGNEESMRVTFKDYGFFVPKDIAGKEVIFTGQVKYTETDVETLRHYAKDEGQTEEEVLAITEPEQSYNFVATGVKLVD